LTGLEMHICAWCTEFCTAQMQISKPVKQEANHTVILPLKCSMINSKH